MGIEMVEIPGYTIRETMYASDETAVYRAEGPTGPVVLKTTAGDFPRPTAVARLRNEHTIGSELQLERTVRYLRLVPHGKTYVLEIEDFAARSLSWLMEQDAEPLSIERFLDIGVALVEALEELHRHDIVHRDVSPNNIFYDPDSGELKLGDLGLASSIPRTRQLAIPPGLLEGTIAYISPEQTGRMNRDVDYRTDLYSVGATLYHLITGRVPFAGKDLIAVIHGHIARDPEPPHQLRPDLPRPVSDVILKLMCKASEDRYQSAAGAAADLRRCRDSLRETGTIESFELARKDHTPIFSVSGQIYGRNAQLASLLAAFDRTAEGGREVVLVRGHAGIGKSALVHEVLRAFVEQHGAFVSGKHDQLSRSPLSALTQALRELLRQILTESEDRLASWRGRIEDVLEGDGGLLFEILPELRRVLGPQPVSDELGMVQTRERFDRLLVGLVRC